jgi:predicted phage terminase large subunit-like protein
MDYNNNNILSEELFQIMVKDRKVRTAITKKSHRHFFHFYFAHYIKYKTAPFQNEIFQLTEEDPKKNLFIVAFRGCGKSTIITTSYPIWSILGEQQKKFILILCQTQSQAKQHMMNMRRELENNTLLKNDLGPFKEESDEWGAYSIVFSNSNARITVASSEQSVRGLRHNQHRPDLIICDDVEDIASTKTRDSRNKTHQWLTSEVIPTGDRNTRLVIVGNLLHEDSLLMRIKEALEEKFIDGIFKEYPLIQNGEILWPGKYPTMEDVEIEKRKAGNEPAWQREYLLKIVSNMDQPIHRDWIHYYDELPPEYKNKKMLLKGRYYDYSKGGYFPGRNPNPEYDYNGEEKDTHRMCDGVRIGIDLAISEKETADYTAMVPVMVVGYGNKIKIYVLPKIINQRATFPDTISLCKTLNETYYNPGDRRPLLIVEDVGYQKALPQQLKIEGINNVDTVRPSADKRSRLVLTADFIKSGKIVFPKEGAEELIEQIVHFGVEKHDDLADAFSIVILQIIDNPPKWIGFA